MTAVALARAPAVAAVAERFPGAEVVDVRPFGDASRTVLDDASRSPRRHFPLSVLAATARAEADRIQAVQAELVRAGVRLAPDVGELERAAQFDQLARFADLAAGDEGLKARLRAIASAAARPLPERDGGREGIYVCQRSELEAAS